MKALLTSEGFCNKTIKQAFYDLLDKPVEETQIVLVTTAANARPGDKKWLIDIQNQLVDMGFYSIDLLDFAGIEKEQWLLRLRAADVIFFSGGDSIHLMYELRRTGLEQELQNLINGRIIVGNSAGSIALTKNLSLSNPKHKEHSPEKTAELNNEAVGLVPFLIRPHYNSPDHPSTVEDVQKLMKEYNVTETVYLLDDESAVLVDGDRVEVVSGDRYKVFNE